MRFDPADFRKNPSSTLFEVLRECCKPRGKVDIWERPENGLVVQWIRTGDYGSSNRGSTPFEATIFNGQVAECIRATLRW